VALIDTVVAAFVTVAVFMNCLFVLALRLRDNSIADVGWGLGFILVALVTLALSGGIVPRQALVLALVMVWGVRLAIRIYRRNRGKGEDFRYREWREKWGEHWRRTAYLFVFVGQGLMMLLISTPILFVNAFGGPVLGWLDLVGVAVWIVGFLFEAVGDRQLDSFLSDPANKGRVMDKGLWRYTRHPNYFGEVTQWWGIFIIALSVQWGWAAVIGPITITGLILFYSGIPLLEKTMMAKPEYREYASRTSKFVPWVPKRKQDS